jgi:hypothetical protein
MTDSDLCTCGAAWSWPMNEHRPGIGQEHQKVAPTDSPATARVWDVFPYWRERWAVDARLRLWADLALAVEYRPVALVGDRTHRGNSLPPPELPAGVEWVEVTLDADGDWGREAQQRDAVRRLLPVMEPDDLVLLCDADELVDPRALPAILAATEAGPAKLCMAHYMCGKRWRYRDWWRHAGACRARNLPDRPSDELRLNFVLPRVAEAGWHLTYFGTDADVDAKLSAFAHAEYDDAKTRQDIARIRAEGGPGWIDAPLTGPLADILSAVAA